VTALLCCWLQQRLRSRQLPQLLSFHQLLQQ
jgi:hypothetical protein